MKALIEIMYVADKSGQYVEDNRVCVRPEYWKREGEEIFLRVVGKNGEGWAPISRELMRNPPKFVIVPIEEARSCNAFCDGARQVIRRNVSLYQCLRLWERGRFTIREALEASCWLNLHTIQNICDQARLRVETIDLGSPSSIEEWLGIAGAVALMTQAAMGLFGRWLSLQNPRPIEVGGVTYVYTPPPDLEEWRWRELSALVGETPAAELMIVQCEKTETDL